MSKKLYITQNLLLQDSKDTNNISCMITKMTDNNGNTIKFTDSKKDKIPNTLLLDVEATHTGINLNDVNYIYENLQLSTPSWTKDYNKPVLLNHNSWSDPLGRVKNSTFCQSEINPQKFCIKLQLEINNKDAIERFLDGRYKTFSIGGYSDSAKCSICGKDIINDGWCGHQRGKMYNNKKCYWDIGIMDYDEISVVNCPADVHSQVTNINLVDENGAILNLDGTPVQPQSEGSSQDSNSNPPTNPNPDTQHDSKTQPPVTPTPNQEPSGSVIIDGLLGKTQNNNNVNNNQEPVKDNKPSSLDPNNIPNNSSQNINDSNKLQEKIEELQNQLLEKDGKITTLEQDLLNKDQALADLNNKIVKLQTDNSTLNNKAISVATYAHSQLATILTDLKVYKGEYKKEERDSVLKNNLSYSSTTLEKQIEDSFKTAPIIPKVIDSPQPNIDDSKSQKNNEVSFDDYANQMIKLIINKNL